MLGNMLTQEGNYFIIHGALAEYGKIVPLIVLALLLAGVDLTVPHLCNQSYPEVRQPHKYLFILII